MKPKEFIDQLTAEEGKKLSISRGQVAEVARLVLIKLANMKAGELARLLQRYVKKGGESDGIY